MLQVYLFGHLRVLVDGQPAKFAGLPKTLPLWAYLLLRRDKPISRDSLAFTLWPDIPEADARSNLRRHLHDLRRALPRADGGAAWLLSDSGSVQWNPATGCWLDVAEFERLSEFPERLADALALYAGDLLEGLYDDCLFFDRERLRNQYFANLARLIAQCRGRGELTRAMAYAQQALARDPLREDMARDLISLRYAASDRAGALQEYRRIERTLSEELGVLPMPETVALYEQIRTGAGERPAAATEIPVEVEPSSASRTGEPPHSLPGQLTAFIGRERELAALHELLCPAAGAGAARLITLTGAGGTGKTRLALEAAARLLHDTPERFPDGAFFVTLSPLEDLAFVPQAIAQVLGVQGTGGRSLLDSLKDCLLAKRLLLILDGFERVVAATPVLTDLLAAAPGVTALVTSRAVLRAYGEHEFPLAPLPLPDLDRLPAPEELAGYPAIGLFIERARAANPAFALTPGNAATVAEICVRLDGLPLAIELAAGRSRLLSPQALLARLSSSLAFLTGQARNLPARQQTLRSTLDWSYNLLDVPAKTLFTRLAAFRGSFSLEGAAALAGDGDGLAVEDGIFALVDQSMLRPVFQPGAEPRFRMGHLLQEYALEKLAASGELPDLRRRHASYFLALAERSEAELRGRRQVTWWQRLEAEHENLRAALAWAVDNAAAEIGLRLAAALGGFWRMAGHLAEGREWTARVLALPQPAALPIHRARALNAAGLLAFHDADYAHARASYEEAATICRACGDRVTLAHALCGLGDTLWQQGEREAAIGLLDASLALCREVGDRSGVAAALSSLAAAARGQGDEPRARALIDESVALYTALGDAWGAKSARRAPSAFLPESDDFCNGQ